MNTLLQHLKQPSTFRGLAILAGLCGYAIDPAQLQAISSAVVAAIGLIELFRREPKI